MRAGKLKYNIELYSKRNIRDEYSGYTENYVCQFTTKADVKYSGGSQQIINDMLFPSSYVVFTIRYRDEVDETYRIKFRDEVYEIQNISIMEPKVGMIIRCTKMLEM